MLKRKAGIKSVVCLCCFGSFAHLTWKTSNSSSDSQLFLFSFMGVATQCLALEKRSPPNGYRSTLDRTLEDTFTL